MSNVRAFLDLYNELERLLKNKYKNKDRRFSSLIMRYENSPEGQRWRDELELCRETRNLLSHSPLVDGEELVSPSPRLLDVLRAIIAEVKDPPTARSICTPTEKLLLCTGCERAVDVIRAMQQKGYSNVPILEDGVLDGVFSAGTLLASLAEGTETFGADSLVSDFSRFLPPNVKRQESYRFAAPDASYYDIKDEFEPGGPTESRVAAIFVTSDGTARGKVIGMITPWDMLRAFPE